MVQDGKPAREMSGAEQLCPGRAHSGQRGSRGMGWAARGHRDELLLNEHQSPLSASHQSTCDPMPNHSENISHGVNVPLQTALGTLEEIAC